MIQLKKNRTYIIAEIGVNHNGNLSNAKKMILASKKAGANAVKFQSYISEDIVAKDALAAEYQSRNLKKSINKQYDILKKYELTFAQQKELFIYAKKNRIDFLSSAFDLKSLAFLKKLKLNYYKIPSGEMTNFQLLNEYSKMKEKIILSTGMSNLKQIKNAVKILTSKKNNLKNLSLLHCTTSYPTSLNEANLNSLNHLRAKFNCKVGFSDHTTNIQASSIAVALGASIIEKHVTLNQNMIGPDHKASLNFKDFTKMVKFIRITEVLLGKNEKIITKSEKKNIYYGRKSLFASKNIVKGEKFTSENLKCLRPQKGVPADKYMLYLGKRSKHNYKKNELIKKH